jgi:hypothetical protein
MRTLLCASVVCVFCACVSGCAAPGASLTTVTARNAMDAIAIGKSTKTDVVAALGQTKGIAFDSGFEVWAYEVTGGTPARLELGALFARADSERRAFDRTEFVVLFAPSGIVAKTRIRPAARTQSAAKQ